MKSRITLQLALLATLFIFAQCKNAASYYEGEENEQDDAQKAMRHEFLMTQDPSLNRVPTERIIAAKAQMEEMQRMSSTLRGDDVNNIAALTWQERGPNNIGGRTRAILVDKNDAAGNTVFAGSVGGGLWKTTNFKNATPTWTSINDFFSNLAITCIAQSTTNNNIMYFGTGEGWGNIDAIDGLGIWKSTDGGSSWSQLSSTTSISYVQDLEFDNNGYIYATTRSGVAGMRGVLRSTDGGSSWTQVLTDPTATTTRGADLERGPNGDMYATLGIFSTGHIFRSPANGSSTGISGSWTEITPAGITTNSYQRTELAVCPNNASRIYAVAQNASTSGIGALYRSDDNGTNWTTLTAPSWCDQGATTNTDFSRQQAWYDLILAVDPTNSSNVIAGGVVLVKTANAGTSWTQASRWTSGATCTTAPVIHADIHEVKYLSATELIVSNDGGIYYSTDGGSSYATKNNSYNVTQYYSVAVHPTSGSNYMLAGAQDNGTHKFSTSAINSVTSATGGDGGFCFISQSNANYQITSFTASAYNRSTNGGTSWSTVVNSTSGRFINPADLGPNDILYFGNSDGAYGNYDVVAGGTNIITISGITLTSLQASAIKADPNTNNIIYIGFSTSESASSNIIPKLVKVTNANGSSGGPPASRPTATEITLPSMVAGTYISSIDIETGNSNHMLLTISNYGVTSVYESTDAGVNWTAIEGNLPDMPVRWGVFVPASFNLNGNGVGGIMLATELGVWTTTTTNGALTNWVSNNSGLANVRTDMIKSRSSDKLIAVATHGRGLFTTIAPVTLPVTLLDFNGALNSNSILLNWSTSSEQNSKEFEIEKATDGIHFYKIATVAASGYSANIRNYSSRDVQVNAINYYRLKMFDRDERSRLSNVIVIKSNAVTQTMWITTNPFRDHIELRFAKPVTKLQVELIGMNGALISRSEYTNPAQQMQWFIPPNIAKGAYILRAVADDNILSKKLIRE
jgi:hypothetical protein